MWHNLVQLAAKSEVCLACCFPANSLKSLENVTVNISGKFNRLRGGQSEANIEDEWTRCTALNARIYNASKFRLDSFSVLDSDGSSSSHLTRLQLNLGITDYREFLGTNMLAMRSNGDTEKYVQAEMSDALGVAALLVSCDEQITLQKRASWCLEEPSKWDVPGGHPEPNKLVGRLSIDEISVDGLDEFQVRSELFDSIRCEICDEVGIERASLSEPLLLGVFRNRRTFGKPSLHFIVRCSLPASEIEQVYNERKHPEADESTRIRFVKLDDVLHVVETVMQNAESGSSSTHDSFWNDLTQSARAIFLFYALSKKLSEPHFTT